MNTNDFIKVHPNIPNIRMKKQALLELKYFSSFNQKLL
jgi:hypothetical protein